MARLLISAAVLAAAVIQVQAGATCGPGQALCPSSAPCCSEFGFCQAYGPYCLGGCNPLSSHALDSCRPMPICQDRTYTFAPGNPTIINGTSYDGNSTAYDWTIDGGTPLNTNNNGGELALILTQDGRAPKGTRVSSTKYLLYGTVTATVKTSKWNGVVGAFITMSNIKDEIDWEWPGNHPTQAQSNFFFQGHVDYTAGHGKTHEVSSDTYENYHDYTINWQPDQLQFSIDGNVVHTVTKAETLVDGVYQYPTSPARIQLSIWPGGLPDSPEGVVTWAGGLIQYNEPEYVAAGNQYQVLVSKVVVQCSTASGLDIGPNTVSYMYGANDTAGLPTVYASNRTALLSDGSARYSLPFIGASAWSLIALAVGAGAALTF